MQYTQLLTFEIGMECQLALSHASHCPAIIKSRYDELDTTEPLSDALIVNTAKKAYAAGFAGMVAWHYYCEPTLYMNRIELLYGHLQEIPGFRHLLWTNGEWLSHLHAAGRLGIFSKIVVSNYHRADLRYLQSIPAEISVTSGRLDTRMVPGRRSTKPCFTPFNELIFDFYGNWHLCCVDYRGTAAKMNLRTDEFEAILDKYQHMRALVSQNPQPECVPAICKTCSVRLRRIPCIVAEPCRAARGGIGT